MNRELIRHGYVALVRSRCSAPAREWFDRTIDGLQAPLDRAAFQIAYAGASRRLGGGFVSLEPDETLAFQTAGSPPRPALPLDEAGRTALLLRAVECLSPSEHPRFVDEVYRRGDSHEQVALLRALMLLPDPERFLSTAVEACRTNVTTVFEAIACANAYPARCFPDPSFNQLVMKAILLGIPLQAVVGIQERVTTELQRMARDYEQERRAAGRPIPSDIRIITDAIGAT